MQAMILAAGLGKRMRPLTDHTPKPLLPVAGKPLLEYQLERLIAAGVSHILINTSYLADQIETFIRSRRWPVDIQLSREATPLETAGGIQQALAAGLLQPDQPLLLVNGDIWCDYDLRQLPALASGQRAHLLLVDNPSHNPQGDFWLQENGQITRRTEAQTGLTFSGISLIDPQLIPTQAQQPPPLPLGPLLKQAADQGTVTGQHYPGYWLDVGTPERLQQLEQTLQARAPGQDAP